ncbi:MAG: hypothetical protein JWN56_1115 [Sphingobacteriales bacterium]|nr:hypothetical protein [Sphingobacteriales bacterium]
MKTLNKIKLANLTTWTMVITISFIALFFIGFVVTNTFDLNVFTSRTSNFIFSFIGFSSVIVLCSAILNISLNISLIADSKSQELKGSEASFVTKKFLFYTLGLIVIIVSFLFLGDFLTRQNEKNKLVSEANDIITRYRTSIDKIPLGLADTSKIGNVPEILKFISNQKQEFPSIALITSDNYNGQLTFLEINEYDNKENLKKPFYGNSFYKCQIQDCNYLNKYFTGKTTENHFWTQKNDYRLYFPFGSKGKKYILLFTKYERNGKIGSY